MNPLAALMIMAIIAVTIVASSAVYGYFKSGARRTNEELKKVKYQSRLAESSLNAISRDAGNPTLEAQLALNNISEVERNELHA